MKRVALLERLLVPIACKELCFRNTVSRKGKFGRVESLMSRGTDDLLNVPSRAVAALIVA